MSHLYRVYEKIVSSETRLRDLAFADGRPDIRLTITDDPRFRVLPRWYHRVRTPGGRTFLTFGRQHAAYRVRCHGIDFLVSMDGRQILTPRAHRDLGTTFVENVLPLAVSLERTVLHASAVSGRGGALAFLGESGAGKSTLAEAFTSRGGKILADDALTVERRDAAILGLPGPGHLRLHRGGENKASIRHIRGAPSPLRAILLLARGGDRPRFDAVTPSDAWRALLAHSFRLSIEDPAPMEREMDRLHDVATRVPVRRLVYPSRRAALPNVVERLLREYNIFR